MCWLLKTVDLVKICAYIPVMNWKPIAGTDQFEISDGGIVRRSKDCPFSKKGHIMKWSPNDNYAYITIKINGVNKRCAIHRLVLETHGEAQPAAGLQVRHLDGNPKNNHISNLKWGTAKENQLDRVAHGTMKFGESVGTSKLTKEDVYTIFKRRLAGESAISIAADFNISTSSIFNMETNKSWKHLDLPRRKRLGRNARGSEFNKSKINEDDVVMIRSMLKQKITLREIAEKFNVTSGCIHHIKTGITWRHVL